MPIPNSLTLNFEDDVTLHNRTLELISTAVRAMPSESYDLNESKQMLKSLAQLIKAKADKQKDLINLAQINMTSTLEITK
jgi:methionine-rich copper-binding protein CopC